MKVLFAVNNDKISEAVIKKYPKEYKELLSYKNVYYFNAILKEIQNDKSYDRIVISEDLEPFVNTNHDSIDNFLFGHLDKISDEAQGNDGKEISIILICSERRTFGSSILSRLFSIGIYNALIGNDRNMDNLCKLINRPRTKKEAKIYYRIDQATYESVVDTGEVSETEIQNILNHFKKLGKSTDRYTDSFNNIAAQYTDDQLKLIINVLPMKVKAVLEEESDKYQSLMGTSEEFKNKKKAEVTEPGIRVNTIGSGRETNISGPIVIPSGIKRFTGTKTVSTNSVVAPQEKTVVATEPTVQEQPKQQVPVQKPIPAQQVPVQKQNPVQPIQEEVQPSKEVVRPETQNVPQQSPVIPKNMGQKPNSIPQDPMITRKEVVMEPPKTENLEEVMSPKQPEVLQHGETKKYTGTISQVKRTLIARRKPVSTEPIIQEQPTIQDTLIDVSVPEAEENEELDDLMIDEPKRGRGRPRKILSEEELNKPKGKRGRPRKNALEEENEIDNLFSELGDSSEGSMLPGLDETEEDSGMLPGLEDEEENNEVLPGLDETEEEDGILPGLEDEEDTNEVLPGLDETEEEDEALPGLEESEEEDEALPGLEESEEEDETLPELEESEEIDDGMIPGLEESEEIDDGMIPGLEESEEIDDGMIPGLGETEETDDIAIPEKEEVEEDTTIPEPESDDITAIPGLDDVEEGEEVDVNSLLADLDDENDASLAGEDDGMMPGLDENKDSVEEISESDDTEETLLPGMGFEDEEDPFATTNKEESNAVESIKPQIDYSMSNLNSLLSKDKKIVAFVGATKNGTSFIINNLALMFSMMGIDVAILDMTQNKNSYYLFTDSREELRKIAYTSLSKLENGYAEGIKFNKNLTVYTGLPSDGTVYENAEPILSTLVQNHSLILIDTDFTTPPAYFASSQEIYLVQSMDILTIQPLTAFLRDLKFKGAWEPEKARVIINKEVPIRILSNKTIIGGMSRYNGPDMTVMTDLFNKDMVKACSIPFDEKVYAKYLETLATCKLSISSLPKQFRAKLQILGEMVYPRLNSKTSYNPSPNMGGDNYNPGGNAFSNNTNNILNKMKKNI